VKKKLKGETKTIASATLYRADLEEILELFTGSCANVKITDDEFEYSNLDEVESKRGKHPKSLMIESDSPPLSLRVHQGTTYLAHGGSDEVVLAYTKIQQLLKSRRRSILFFFFNPFMTVFMELPLVALLILASRHPVGLWLAILLALFMVGIPLIARAVIMGGLTRILLVNRHDEQGFWAANKHKIWLILLGAIIGGVLAKIIPFLLTKLGM